MFSSPTGVIRKGHNSSIMTDGTKMTAGMTWNSQYLSFLNLRTMRDGEPDGQV